jgi:uncharacterized protein (TIGR03435 family)
MPATLKSRKRLLLAAATLAALTVALTVDTLTTARLYAQSPSDERIAFEVASIKPTRSESGRTSFQFVPGRFTATNCTLKDLIQFSYFVQDYQLPKGPDWINSARYDIDAKVPDSIADDLRKLTQIQQVDPSNPIKQRLLQSLLADRFKLEIAYKKKAMPVYVLVVAKGGPKLAQTATTPGAPGSNSQGAPPNRPRLGITGRGQITGTGVPVSALATILSRQLGREVLDKTGLKGTYDLKLQWTPDETQPLNLPERGQTSAPSSAAPSDSSGLSIFTALQEQLGLRLESKKGTVDTLVINHVEQPSPN